MGYSIGHHDFENSYRHLQSFACNDEDTFTLIAENIPLLLWTATPDGEINYCNPQWSEYLGPDKRNLDLSSLNKIIHPEDVKHVIEDWPTVFAEKKVYEAEFRLKRYRDKKYIWFMARATPIKDDLGTVIKWLGFCIDINDLKEAKSDLEKTKQELVEATLAKSQFLANMSHEIRTPLGVIIGFADLALDAEEAHADAHDYLMAIKRNSQQLTHIIREVLDLSKAEAGKLEIDETQISLTSLMQEIVEGSKEKAHQKGLEFVYHPDASLPDYVDTDPVRLKQVLNNLIANAIKFTGKGEVKLLARMTSPKLEGQPVHLEFVVADTGIGIPQIQQSKLFKPFCNISSSLAKANTGEAGMGLILGHQMAKAMGGDLWLESSTPGKGSVFILTIEAGLWKKPMLITDPFLVKRIVSTQPEQALKDKKILLVEDSPDNQVLVNHYLTGTGATVVTANNGFEGVEKASQMDFDVILMDIQMPVMDGYQATKYIRQNGFNKPIIALTAHALRQEQERALNSGFNVFLTKPISRQVLIESLARTV